MVLDKTHTIKNENTKLNITINWLDTDFYIFLSAILLLSKIKNYRGFLKFIESKNTAKFWYLNNLETIYLVRNVNPYLLRYNYSRIIFRAILRAADTFIFKTNILTTIGGYRLRDI